MKVNKELFEKIADHIEIHPDQWSQETWVDNGLHGHVGPGNVLDPYDCGTSACIAGWAVMLSRQPIPNEWTMKGAELLGLQLSDAHTLFDEYWRPAGYSDDNAVDINAKYAAEALRAIGNGADVDDVTKEDEPYE